MELKQAIIVRNDLKMQKGKIASQVAHASVSAAYKTLQKNPNIFHEWFPSMKKIILKVDSEAELLKLKQLAGQQGLVVELIRDAGRTQIPSGSTTALGIGPDSEEKIDKIVKHLKLL